MDMLGQNYVLKGMVQCVSHHITVAIKDGTPWVYVDDMCDSVKITLHARIFFIAIPKLGFLQYLRSERTCISKLKLLLMFVTVTFCVKILLMKLSSNCLNSHSNIPENW